jgi:sensor histidine kinase YesM
VLQQQNFWHRIMLTWPETAVYLLPGLFLAYTLMYLVIPKLVLAGRYLSATLSTVALVILTAGFSALLSVTVIDYLRHVYADGISKVVANERHPPFYVQFGVAMLAGLRGSITVGGIAAAIKLIKCFYEKQQAALEMEKEKVNAELQMLKAQLHPHFLFNTLNNVYSITQGVSPRAADMIMGLSQILRYILYDCNKPLVPLDKELEMISRYIELESIRYDRRLDISLQLPRTTTNLLISPLLLLPFVENAFKHGTSQMRENPWISLMIETTENQLLMKLINGKPSDSLKTTPGIGIANVRKRLDVLYKGGHELRINDEDDIYVVNLKLNLAIISIPASKQLNDERVNEI